MLSNKLYSCFLNLLNNGIDLISLGNVFQILNPFNVTPLHLISVRTVGKKKSFSCPGICASFDLTLPYLGFLKTRWTWGGGADSAPPLLTACF